MTRGAKRVLEFLRDRQFHTLAEIERECGVEGRSRLSELRAEGHVLERKANPGGHGKAMFSHRLVRTAIEAALDDDAIAEAEESPLAELVEGMPASSTGSASDEEGRGVVDGGGVGGSAAAATTPTPEQTTDELLAITPTPVEANGDSSAEGERIPPSAEPAESSALDERGSAAAHQTPAAAAPASNLVEALPPPSSAEQLQLEEVAS